MSELTFWLALYVGAFIFIFVIGRFIQSDLPLKWFYGIPSREEKLKEGKTPMAFSGEDLIDIVAYATKTKKAIYKFAHHVKENGEMHYVHLVGGSARECSIWYTEHDQPDRIELVSPLFDFRPTTE